MHGLVFVGRSRRASASLPGGSTGHSGVTRLGKGCRLSWKRRPEVHPRRRRPSSVQNQPFLGVFSATQPHKGSRIIETYGAGDGNRTHVRSLGSWQYNSKTRWTGGIFAIFGTP